MHNPGLRYPMVGDLAEAFPVEPLALTAPTERPVPPKSYLGAEQA